MNVSHNPPMQTPSPFRRDLSRPSQPMAALIQEPNITDEPAVHPEAEVLVTLAPGLAETVEISAADSLEELKRKQEEIERQIAEKQQAEKDGVIQQILEVAKTYNVTIEDLIEAFGGFKPKRKGVKAIPKYRDPVSGVTWSGRGKEPTWMRGEDREKFLIKD